METKKIFILDTMALIYRAHFAMIKSPIITSYNLNTSAIYGFTNTLLGFLTKYKPTHMVAAIDSFEETFRQAALFEYKANRDAQPEDITIAIPYVENLLDLFNIKLIKYPGYEADDIIGTLVKKFQNQNIEIYIVSMDKDFAQLLVTDKIFIYKPSTNYYTSDTILSQKDILEKWDIQNVEQVCDILGLQGDASDNIPGVPSIGPKTASKLLKDFNSIENILANTDKLSGNIKKNLEEFADQAIISKKLATIITDLELNYCLNDLELIRPNIEQLLNFFNDLEFKKIIKKIEEIYQYSNSENNPKTTLNVINSQLHKLTSDFVIPNECKKINVMIENDLLYLQIDETNVYFIEKKEIFGNLFLKKIFSELFQNETIKIITFDAKLLINTLYNSGINVKKNIEDLQILFYLLQSDYGNSLKSIFQQFSFNFFEGESNYKNLIYFSEIYENLKIEMQHKNLQGLLDFEIKVCETLQKIESNGVFIEKKILKSLKENFENELSTLTEKIHTLAGEKFNISSPKQLGIVLFENLKIIENPTKTKSGQYATNEEILQTLTEKHAVIEPILHFRELQKLTSTYLDGILKLLDHQSFIHTTYSQVSASTGRIISSNPNLQNIPIKTELGKKIRTIFTSRYQDGLMLSADYSQIELRIIAFLANDDVMLSAFSNDRDIHAETAAKIFKVSSKDVSSEMRRQAKSVNFGIIYGISPYGLSKQLSIKKKEAENIIEAYFQEFPKIKEYINTQLDNAKELGYVSTLLGKKHYLRDIKSRNNVIRTHAERNAINTPIQGTAAEIIKIATTDVQIFLEKENLNSKLVMQVHDELVLDIFPNEIEKIKDKIKIIMENIDLVKIPLKVDVNFGKNWMEASI